MIRKQNETPKSVQKKDSCHLIKDNQVLQSDKNHGENYYHIFIII